MVLKKEILGILKIPKSVVFIRENDLDRDLELANQHAAPDKKCVYLCQAIVSLDKFHSYFHFEQSFVCSLLAYMCSLKQDKAEVADFAAKALFQDPLNHVAKDFQAGKSVSWSGLISYDKNYRYEQGFLKFVGGAYKPHPEIITLDQALEHLFDQPKSKKLPAKYKKSLRCMKHLSHRLHIARALDEDGADALKHAKAALSCLESSHKAYHQYAASLYRSRADLFKKLGQIDLSKNDIIRANNLFPNVQL